MVNAGPYNGSQDMQRRNPNVVRIPLRSEPGRPLQQLTEEDIILEDELSSMPGLNYKNVIGKHIDRATLEPFIEKDRFYYICGPVPFVVQMMDYLRELGVPVSQIVVEQD